MPIFIRQTLKELYSAEFEIVRFGSEEVLGYLLYQNKKGMSELSGVWTGKFISTSLVLSFEAESILDSLKNNHYRPCEIFVNGERIGQVSQKEEKTSLFSAFSFHQMNYDGQDYTMYPIGLGNDGIKNPVYSNGTQIAQIDKDIEVINEMHNFNIYSINEFASLISVIFCCYMYTVAYYKHGVKVKKSKEKFFSKTTNKKLLSKYNPRFKSENDIY